MQKSWIITEIITNQSLSKTRRKTLHNLPSLTSAPIVGSRLGKWCTSSITTPLPLCRAAFPHLSSCFPLLSKKKDSARCLAQYLTHFASAVVTQHSRALGLLLQTWALGRAFRCRGANHRVGLIPVAASPSILLAASAKKSCDDARQLLGFTATNLFPGLARRSASDLCPLWSQGD